MIVYIVSNLSDHLSLASFAETTKVFLKPELAAEQWRAWGGGRWPLPLNFQPGTKNIDYQGDTKLELLTLEVTEESSLKA